MDGSPATFPADLFEPAVLDYDRHGGISVGYRQHLLSEFHVVLRVALFEGDAPRGVRLASFRAIGTAGLRIYSDFQLNFLRRLWHQL